MPMLSRFTSLWRNLTQRTRVERDLDAELRTYVDLLSAEKIRAGMSASEARRAAMIEIGGVEQVKEEVREARVGFLLETVLQDLRYALRSLRRTPVFTIAVVSCFALGIGVNTVMFGVVDTLFLRAPSGVVDPGRVGRLYSTATLKGLPPHTRQRFTIREYYDSRDALAPTATVAAYWSADVAVGRGAAAEHVVGAVATASFLPLLGVRANFGRLFDSSADYPGAPTEAVISYGYWNRRFLRDRSVVGQSLRVGSRVYTVIGVAQTGFCGIDLDPVDVWLPLGPAAPDVIEPEFFSGWNAHLNIVARLRPGATARSVEQALMLVQQRRAPDIQFQETFGALQGARGPARAPEASVVVWVALVSVVVLIIACANVAALQFGRAAARRKEYAIRLALGAGRGRLIGQIVAENALLSLAGAGIALAVSFNLAATAQAFLLPAGHVATILAPARMIAFSVITAIVAGVASGIVPALQSTRRDQRTALAEPLGTVSLRYGARRAVLVTQVALTLSLLVMAGLFVRSVRNARGIDLGLEPSNLLLVTLDLQGSGKFRGPELITLYRTMLDRVKRMPQVQHASISQGSPLGGAMAAGVFLPGQPPPRGFATQYLYPVSAEYLATMGMRLLRGRGLLGSDQGTTAPVAVINDALAREVWRGEDPVGKCFHYGDSPCITVVGVVANTKVFRVTDPPRQLLYLPFEQGMQSNSPMVTLEVRTIGAATDAIGSLRRELMGADPELPYVNVQRFSDRIETQVRPWALGSSMFTVYGVLALLLSGVGLYGLLTYSVAQRTREIGIRMALGAESARVLRMVVGDGLKMTLIGVLIGAAGGVSLGRAMASLLLGVSPYDGSVLGIGAGSLMLVALAASYLPGLRATRIDPNLALRAE